MNTCVKSHPECQRIHNDMPPTRLLDLGGDRLANSNIKLITASKSRKYRYACLSHRWGSSGPAIKTVLSNTDPHMECIQWRNIPKTFRETISFVRALKIRYLWIDALCIIQDDENDWDKECGSMSSVYSNSFVTIGATQAPDEDFGIFSADRSSFYHKLSACDRNGVDLGLYGGFEINHTPFTSWDIPDLDLPLLSRAWVHQERLLSPRFIHFTPYEIVWECKTMSSCECGKLDNIKRPHKVGHHTALQTYTPKQLSFWWGHLASFYSTKELTFHKDKLPALSGIAKQVQKRKNGAKYLAGLWEDDLLVGLTWHHMYPPGPGSVRRNGPSWSWSSYAGSIYECFSGACEIANIYIEIHDAGCELIGSDPMGEAKSGYITLTTILEPINVLLDKNDWPPKITSSNVGLQFPNYPDSESKKSLIVGLDYPYDALPDDMFLLRLGDFLDGGRTVFCGLLIHPIKPGDSRYIRVGLVCDSEMSGWMKSIGAYEKLAPTTITLV
jgi:hypothetical protein